MKIKVIISLICLVVAGCKTSITQKESPSTPIAMNQQKVHVEQSIAENEESSLQKQPEKPKAEIDTDVTYSIIKSDTYLDWKRSIDVRLNKKVSESMLRTIALKLKAQDSKSYERTFICYYLPGMQVDSGAWATTHFDPNLKVKILGMTIEQETALKQLPVDSSREIIGVWFDQGIFVGGKITIFRQDGKLFMENVYKDGSSGKKEIVEKTTVKGKAFERKEGSSAGEYYLIDNQGHLQYWDDEGYLLTANKIN